MLKLETIKIKIRADFVEYYTNLGYDVINVNIVCDGCNKELSTHEFLKK